MSLNYKVFSIRGLEGFFFFFFFFFKLLYGFHCGMFDAIYNLRTTCVVNGELL